MIQEYIRDELNTLIPDLRWSYDYSNGDNHTGIVYYEGGPSPDEYESGFRYPSYMVYLRSSAYDYIKTVANRILEEFHRDGEFTVSVNRYDRQENVIGTENYRVYFIRAASDINRIGIRDGIMEYSVNFDATIRKIREDE